MARTTSSQYYARTSTGNAAAFAVPKAPGSGHPRRPQITAAIIEAKAAHAAECIGLCSAAKADVPGQAFVMRTMRQMPLKLRI